MSHFLFRLCGKGYLLMREGLKCGPTELSAVREKLPMCTLPHVATDVKCGLCGQGTEVVYLIEVNIKYKHYKYNINKY